MTPEELIEANESYNDRGNESCVSMKIALEAIQMAREDSYTPYCPTCDSCGESGCCSPDMCVAVQCHYKENNLKSYSELSDDCEEYLGRIKELEGVLREVESKLREILDNK